MRKLLVQLFVFLCPIIILLIPPTYILFKAKENFYHIDNLLAKKDKYLIGYAYNEINYGSLKWSDLDLNTRRNVWALGSSRVLQFRKQMFDSSFYNVGYTIGSINDFRPFLKSVPVAKYPKYIIIGLDQWMFNSFWDDLNTVRSIESWKNSFNFFPQMALYSTVYDDLLVKKKINFSSLQKDKTIKQVGLNSIINNTGFRNDGSMQYGRQIAGLINHSKTVEDYEYSDTFERIKKGNQRFEYGTSVNEKALIELAELLKYFKRHKIEVIAILPPFADKVYDKMTQSNKYRYLPEIYNKIKPLFDHYKYEIYDFSKVSLCGSDDTETIDGFHGGEVTYQKIMIKMLDAGSALNGVANIKRLKLDIMKRKNNYQVYDY